LLSGETGNVSLTCRTFGISRKTFYEWRTLARAYGLEALMPKAQRRPQLPNATPTHVLHELLALAVAEPTLGCRQLSDRLAHRGYVVCKTTVQKLLVDHGLGRRAQRVARAAALAALVNGLVTEPVADSTIRQLQAEADAWLHGYHHRRHNHGDFMRGRTPRQVLTEQNTQRPS
jgi:hypothetical protein